MSRGSGTTRELNIWVETVNKEDKLTKKAEVGFFDRDKAFKTVAGEEAITPEKTKIHYPTTKSRVFSVVD